MAKSPPLESTVTKNIIKYLNSLPHTRARKIPGTAFGGGWPDVIAVIDGRAVFIEVKRPKLGKPPTELQEAELRAWSKANAVCMVATSVEEVQLNLLQAGILPSS